MEGGEKVGIVHIYSEYPDYQWVGDEDEGIACIDDATRAAIFYLMHANSTGSEASLMKARMLLKFVLNMQAENGYFYNFLWPDCTIHREGQTTRAEASWWSWRALWLFAEASGSTLLKNDPLLERVIRARTRLVEVILEDASATRSYLEKDGLRIPQWLPHGSATDQAALMILGLTRVYEETGDKRVAEYLDMLSDGLVQMQLRDKNSWTFGAFLSWESIWHAYGNSQAYALLGVGHSLDRPELIEAALDEINYFYSAFHERDGLNWFQVKSENGNIDVVDEAVFSQIAYGLRPQIWACIKAAQVTGDRQYLDKAFEYFDWFNGSNIAKTRMYDPGNGICYDGIINQEEINKNSGAESTIEALLSLQLLTDALQASLKE